MLVSFKLCKLEAKTVAKVFGKFHMFRTYDATIGEGREGAAKCETRESFRVRLERERVSG